ncbi:reverse transcriptase domain-containing protein [Bacteroides fragilis]
MSDSLAPVFNRVSSVSYAYQKGKSTRDALIRLKRIHNPENILLKIDIKHFFDEIDKRILTHLLSQYPIDEYVKSLIYKSINPIVDYSALKKSDIDKFPKGGIPQGNPISTILSNLYLYELDRLAISNDWKMVRYADDIVFSVPNIEEAQLILSQVEKYLLDTRKLVIHPLKNSSDAKTAIFLNPKNNSMKYLGVIFDGQNLFPTKECCYQLIGKIKTILKCTSTSEEKEFFIKKAIAQWCGYYAFTDIPNSQIKWMNNAINYQIGKCKLDIPKVNIANVVLKTRKRQNNRLLKLFYPIQIGEEYRWLNIYG